MNRRDFLQTSGLVLASGSLGRMAVGCAASPAANGEVGECRFPLMDLHVHRSEKLSIERIVQISEEQHMPIGVMQNVAPWGIKNDDELRAYIEELRPYPVFIGLQPMSPGWSKNLSADLIAQADYIVMDPQIVPNGNKYGETIHLWEYTAYVDDAEEFMKVNMRHYMDILTGSEPLDVFACPFFLPICIQREYEKLWTKKRLTQIIDAAKAKNVAIEINDTVQVPHEEFILMAKKAGLKFTFGSDARNHTVGRLDYCKRVARQCGLTERDFFLPERKG